MYAIRTQNAPQRRSTKNSPPDSIDMRSDNDGWQLRPRHTAETASLSATRVFHVCHHPGEVLRAATSWLKHTQSVPRVPKLRLPYCTRHLQGWSSYVSLNEGCVLAMSVCGSCCIQNACQCSPAGIARVFEGERGYGHHTATTCATALVIRKRERPNDLLHGCEVRDLNTTVYIYICCLKQRTALSSYES